MCFAVVADDEYHRKGVFVALLSVQRAGMNNSGNPDVSP